MNINDATRAVAEAAQVLIDERDAARREIDSLRRELELERARAERIRQSAENWERQFMLAKPLIQTAMSAYYARQTKVQNHRQDALARMDVAAQAYLAELQKPR